VQAYKQLKLYPELRNEELGVVNDATPNARVNKLIFS